MFTSAYLTCGIMYSFYTFKKIFQNKESFFILFEQEFGEKANINIFFLFMFLTNLFAWPIVMLNELNNKQDL